MANDAILLDADVVPMGSSFDSVLRLRFINGKGVERYSMVALRMDCHLSWTADSFRQIAEALEKEASDGKERPTGIEERKEAAIRAVNDVQYFLPGLAKIKKAIKAI